MTGGSGLMLFLLFAVTLIGVALWLRHYLEKSARSLETSSRSALQQTSDELVRRAAEAFTKARQQDVHEIELKRQKIDDAVSGLNRQLKTYEELIKRFESDRDQKYGRLENELERSIQETGQLRQTTTNLVSVLGNSRIRGQWGQKMAEDILRLCGLQENIHYLREKEMVAGRPDYTFLLPEDHKLFMDVKFPLDHYWQFTKTQDRAEQEREKEQFVRDVREHIRTMEKRDYASAGTASLDYILIFIPNEQVYGQVNEWMPGLIDECLQKRTILCGPWTIYAIVRIIFQAWQNYHFSLSIKDIVKTIKGFMQDSVKFKERFADLGELLRKATEKYEEITVTSYRRMDSKLQQIEAYRKGNQIPEEGVLGDSAKEALVEMPGGLG